MASGFILNNAMIDFSWKGRNIDTSGLLPSQVINTSPTAKTRHVIVTSYSDIRHALVAGDDVYEIRSILLSGVYRVVEPSSRIIGL